jgi:hypothetical protein
MRGTQKPKQLAKKPRPQKSLKERRAAKRAAKSSRALGI